MIIQLKNLVYLFVFKHTLTPDQLPSLSATTASLMNAGLVTVYIDITDEARDE